MKVHSGVLLVRQCRGQDIHEIGRLAVHAPDVGLAFLQQLVASALQGASEARGASTGTRHLIRPV